MASHTWFTPVVRGSARLAGRPCSAEHDPAHPAMTRRAHQARHPWVHGPAHFPCTTRSTIFMDWRDRAACLDEDPELFFPIGNTGPAILQIEEAKVVCRRCEVT